MNNLLILCTGNACRSQITEGYFRALLGDEFLVRSAGIEAHGLNSTAVAVMEEVGVDISDHQSEVVTDAMIQWADGVITVCGNAQEACPVLPAGVKETHWPIPDPDRQVPLHIQDEKCIQAYRNNALGIILYYNIRYKTS